MMKIQTSYASSTKITDLDVKKFLKNVLESKNKRNYTIVVLLAYTGLRISEALSIKILSGPFAEEEKRIEPE